jgi:tRNA pseudouridine55 synthase
VTRSPNRGFQTREPCLACGFAPLEREANLCPGSGILNIDKPQGFTSHDLVVRVRQASGIRRVGHAGTLDPMATGVLLVCFGQGTRVSQYLMESPKAYRAQVRLGITTDTGDAEGRVISRSDPRGITLQEIERALASFQGRIQQVPPIYSALKKKGVPLYRLARQGVPVEPAPRGVEIFGLEILDWTLPFLEIEVTCSPGTYMRALARDLGEKVGCGAHLSSLTRLRCGRFTLEEAVALQEVEEAFHGGFWGLLTHPIDEALLQFEAVILDKEKEKRVRHGQSIPGEPAKTPFLRVYSISGEFIALLAFEEGLWRPKKVFQPL